MVSRARNWNAPLFCMIAFLGLVQWSGDVPCVRSVAERVRRVECSSRGVVDVCGNLRGNREGDVFLCALSLLDLLACGVDEADDFLRGAADGLK